MKSFTKTLVTKRQLAEIMTRPLNLNIPDEYMTRVKEKVVMMPNKQFLREAKKCTNLDIVPFLNNTFFIRHEILS